MQDIDVETLMQEIKQWGPQDQGQRPLGDAPPADVDDSESQPPCRLDLDKADEPSASPQQSLTPNHSQAQQDEASCSDKASHTHTTPPDLPPPRHTHTHTHTPHTPEDCMCATVRVFAVGLDWMQQFIFLPEH